MTQNNDSDRELYSLLEFLKGTRNFDFSNYKRASLERRLARRMQVVGIGTYADYQDFLEVHPEEFSPLFNSILINVTAFFRDPLTWNFLVENVLPSLVGNKPGSEPIRVWSAGCSSGEEPCSLAIVLAEILGKKAFQERVKIYATDIDEEALNQARKGRYTEKDLQAVPIDFREKYFEPSNGRFAFNPDLRRSIIFGRHDLFHDAPISRLDLLACRNTLMYFNADVQAQILPRFHFALNDQGYLFLGKAELLLKHTSLFSPLEIRQHIFAKVPNITLRDRLMTATQFADNPTEVSMNGDSRIQLAAFDSTPQAQIVIDNNNMLAMFNDQARNLFGLNGHDLKRPLQDLEISYRPVELRSLIEQVYNERHSIVRSNVIYHLPRGEDRILDIQVTLLQTIEGNLLGTSIVFADVTRYQELKDDLQRYTRAGNSLRRAPIQQ
jgi:two-component system CheB/CheR fusion protein